MIVRYRRLAERIRNELADLERQVYRAQRAWKSAPRVADTDVYIDAVALNLHGFYSGIERLFELIATQVDERVPGGEAWHRQLLDQMAQAVSEVRPAVIPPETVTALDEFRRFRHLVRNVYTTNIDASRLQSLMTALSPLWEQVRMQLTAFADFLDQLSHADEIP